MGAWRDGSGNLGEMKVHRMGIACRQDQRGALAVRGADRPENIGRGRTLVASGGRSRSAQGPTTGDLVLLPYAGFIREPNLYLVATDAFRVGDLTHWHRSMSRQRTIPSIAGMGPRSTSITSAARCASFSRDGLPGALPSMSPPGPRALNLTTQSRTICSVTPPISAASLRDEPSLNGSQRQKAARLSSIFGLPSLSSQSGRIVIVSQRCGHGEPLSFASPGIRTDSRRSSFLSRRLQDLV
jgi:hypothetical protein